MTDTKMIKYDSEEAAKQATVTGWISSNGRFWSKDEHMARWDGCTHVKCACGNYVDKMWTACNDCRDKHKQEMFEKMPKVLWDYQTPICIYDTDQYFFDEQELLDYCDDEDLKPEDLQLVLCKEEPRHKLNAAEFLEDSVHEDWDPSEDIEKAVVAFNEAVAKDKYPTWWATNTRIELLPSNPTGCCNNEKRSMNGGCTNCGDPSF